MIEAQNLKKVYSPKKGVSVRALDGVSLKLPDTGMIFILGKSGSGKSTLLNTLGGLDSVDSGEILIKGKSFKNFKQKDYDSYRNTYVGFIFQEYNILEEFTIGANIALAIELQGSRATDEQINEILKKVDLDGLGSRKPNELSGGQKQRVAIARALVKNPEIIMADEPTGALDSKTGKQVFDTLKNLSKEKLVLIVSHDRDFAEQYADRIIELADGKIISDVELDKEKVDIDTTSQGDGLDYDGDKITIKSGYSLTEEDRIAINSYIASLRDGATINIGLGKKKISSASFIPTDESKIVAKESSVFKLIKSRLSLHNSFKLGASGLKHKKFRLGLTIFLSFIAFTLFGIADTVASYDSISTAVSSIKDTNIDYASFKKSIKATYGGNEDDFYWNGNLLLDSDINTIKEKTGIDVIGVYKPDKYSDISFNDSIKTDESNQKYRALYSSEFSGIAEISIDGFSKYGYEFTGTIPDGTKNEIAVSSYVYSYFNKVGLKYYDETEAVFKVAQINSKNDLIGKKLKISGLGSESVEYTVTGIFDTKFDESRYNLLIETDFEHATMSDTLLNMALSSELASIQDYSLNCVCVVGNGFIANQISKNSSVFTRLDGSSIELKKIAEIIPHYESGYTWNEEKTSFNLYANKVAKLSQVGNSNVIFFDPSKTSLGETEFIIPFRSISSIVSSSYPENYFNPDALVGFEKQYSDAYGGDLSSILGNYKYIALYKYASENIEAAKSAMIAYYESNYAYEHENAVNTVNGMNDADLCREYASAQQTNNENADIWNAYRSEIIEKYELSSFALPNASLPDGFDYINTMSDYMNNIWSIESKKYAYSSENFEKAKEQYQIQFPSDDISTVSEDYIKSVYYNKLDSLQWNNTDNDLYNQISVACANSVISVLPENILTGNTLRFFNNGKEILIDGTASIVGISLINEDSYLIIPDNIFDENVVADGIYSFAVGPMPTDDGNIRKAVEVSYEEDGDVKYELSNSVTFELFTVDDILEVLGQVFLYVGIGFALFASLMLSNFIATSISYKKQEIGILRAIGSRSTDVFKIFFSESFIIAMINYVLSIAGTLAACMIANKLIREDVGLQITFLNFGIRQLIILFGVSLLIALIATFLPVRKTASKKPVDAIRNR